jgi:hypothetical protein
VSAVLLAVVLASGAGADSAPSDPVFVRLERDGCFGSCPMYAIDITRAGVLRYDGRRFVKTTGPAERRLSAAQLRALRAAVVHARFEDIDPRCCDCMDYTDMPTVTVTLTEGGASRTIRDYHGCSATPKRLRTLEEDIDRVVGIDSLIGAPADRRLREP